MKKTMVLYLLSLLVFLVGCNTRQNVTEMTLNGTYELVDFISSNINIGEPVHNPYHEQYQRIIHIEESTVTLRDMNYENQTEIVHVYTITMDFGYYFEMQSIDNMYIERIYTNVKAGILEMIDHGSETKHFIFSKYETPKQVFIPTGTYEMDYAHGFANGQMVSIELWEQFELKIKNATISLIKRNIGGQTETNKGTYRAGVIGIETNMGDYVEYLKYDPSEKTLTYSEKYYSFSQPNLNRDYYYIFKLKT